MAEAMQGDKVKVTYTGKLGDGTVFDSSEDREPLEFTMGSGQVIPGFEEGVAGMNPGESKTITIPSDQAYGPHHDDLVMVVGRAEFPEELKPEVGDYLQLRQPDGGVVVVAVTDLSDEDVTLDGNHPLAGQDLTFDVNLVEVG